MRRSLAAVWDVVVWLSIPFVVGAVVAAVSTGGALVAAALLVAVAAVAVVSLTATLGHVRARQAAVQQDLLDEADGDPGQR